VTRSRRELRGVVSLEMAPVEGAMPGFAPGQFNMLYAFGIGEIPISISGDPADAGRLVHTVRDVGAVSGAIARLSPGAMVGLRGPFGAGWPVATGEGLDVVFVAGGLGLAPLRPAIFQVLAQRARHGRVVLLYGARAPGDILFRTQLERWRRRLDIDVAVTVDRAGTDWRGTVGVVPRLIARAGFDPAHTVAMVCGPEVMMRFSALALQEAGVAAERIHLSLERNMECAVGLCGHCQFGPDFVCRDGPVARYDRIASRLSVPEL
jgi:NAD(P)H-flavin reductase